MDDNSAQKRMDEKAKSNRLGDIPVSRVMTTKLICLRPDHSIKSTIETFRVHRISGAPVVSDDLTLLGIVSEYDLLIQAAAKALTSPIDYNKKVFSVKPTTSLKDILIFLYKNRLKRIPVVDEGNHVVGSISRIDVLSFIAENEPSI